MSEFDGVEFRVSFSNVGEALTAGFKKSEITKVTESGTDYKTLEKYHRVKYYAVSKKALDKP